MPESNPVPAMRSPEKQPLLPVSPLDARQMQCLQQMGITVWQRRGSACTPGPEAYGADVQPATASEAIPAATVPESVRQSTAGAAVSATGMPAQISGQAAEMGLMSVQKSAADAAITQASVMIVRASALQHAAPSLNNDEYQLLQKMMESIGLRSNQWISASETIADTGVSNTAAREADAGIACSPLAKILDTSGASVLLLLLPATELANRHDRWVDLKLQNSGNDTMPQSVLVQRISISGNTVAVAPLCDPQDLLLDGSLKRDAWECLKRVRAVIAQQTTGRTDLA